MITREVTLKVDTRYLPDMIAAWAKKFKARAITVNNLDWLKNWSNYLETEGVGFSDYTEWAESHPKKVFLKGLYDMEPDKFEDVTRVVIQ